MEDSASAIGRLALSRAAESWPSHDVEVGRFLFIKWPGDDGRCFASVDLRQIQNAWRAGWNLKYVYATLTLIKSEDESENKCEASLLDIAILCGQSDCAEAVAHEGVELRADWLDLHRGVRDGDMRLKVDGDMRLSVASPNERRSAASASARGFLRAALKQQTVEKGQVMAKLFRHRGFPMVLLNEILIFSMAAPKILDQLDLWDEVSAWIPSIASSSSSTSPEAVPRLYNQR